MTREDELNEVIETAKAELSEIWHEKRCQMIGKCFKYRTWGGTPKGHQEWWVYLSVIGLTENDYYITWHFECIDSYFEINLMEYEISLDDFVEIVEITGQEFTSEWNTYLEKLVNLKTEIVTQPVV